MNETKRTVNILWTGGWDSTYRMVELSRMDVIIQPLYVYAEGRISEKYEIRAMEKIINKLNNKTKTKATILPIDYIPFNSIDKNRSITAAYENIANEIPLGGQYEWLPCLALKYNNLEIGIEKAPPEQSGAINAIQNYGQMYYNKKLDTFLLDTKNSTDDLSLLFNNLSFPIIDKTGLEMKDNITQWGYKDVMENVWMCFTPIFGKPCGLCNPCKSKIETNMEFLLAPSSIKRYKKRNNIFFKYVYSFLKKISYQIDKIRFKKYKIG